MIDTKMLTAFLDAADELLSAQQRLMPQPLSAELQALTEAYLARRLEALDWQARCRFATVHREVENGQLEGWKTRVFWL